MPDAPVSIRERLVLDWQGPVYGLALRMLRNQTEAEDATQDVFVRLLDRADQYDPTRPMAPWVYKVATSVILNRARKEALRRGGRTHDLPERHRRREETPMEQPEDRAVIEACLDELPPDERVALLLHFQHGLSKRETAQVLSEARTTVQSRTARGLERIKASLQAAGYGALVPQIDGALSAAPGPAVPTVLSQNLLSMAASSAAVAPAAAGLATLGGIAVTKTMLAATGAAALVLLATGFAVGRIAAGETASDPADRIAALEALEAENARLRNALESASSPRLAGTGAVRADDAGVAARTPVAKPLAEAAPGSTTPSPLAWAEFAEALAENIDLILEQRGQRKSELTPEDERRVMTVLTAYMKVSSAARVLAPRPYFDERVLPGFVDAVYGPSVGFEAGDRERLRQGVTAILKEEAGDKDLADLTPLERFALRDGIQNRIDDLVEGTAEARGKSERFEKVKKLALTLMRGSHGRRVIGVTPPDAARAEDGVLRVWKDVYGIADEKLESLRGNAAALISAGRDVLARHDLLREGARWDAETHPQVAREMLRAQMDVEAGLIRDLQPEQREHAAKKDPHLIQFAHGAGGSSVHVSSGGI